MTTKTVNGSLSQIVWQEVEDGVGEPAILISYYKGDGMIGLSQEARYVNVSGECVEELIRAIRATVREGKSAR